MADQASKYGPEFDRIADEWRVIENAHDREHPDRNDCGGVGGCTMMRVAHQLEQDMIDKLDWWRKDQLTSARRTTLDGEEVPGER